MENQENPKLDQSLNLIKSIIVRGEIIHTDTNFYFKLPNELSLDRKNLILQNISSIKITLDSLTKILTE